MTHQIAYFFLGMILIGTSTVAADFDATRAAKFINQHCVSCHNDRKHEADVRLNDLSDTAENSVTRWLAVRDQLRDGLMPPEKQPRPDPTEVRQLIAWISAKTPNDERRLPNHGNLVPHELLFGRSPGNELAASPSRLWRLSPQGYFGFVRDVHRGRQDGIVQPFTLTPERGIKDFSGLYTVDESSTEILLRNAEAIVNGQTAHEIVDGKVRGKNDTVGEFVKLMDPKIEPSQVQIMAAVQQQFRMAVGRKPSEAEIEPYWKLYEKCAADGDRPAALKTVLSAVLLRGDAMHRFEMGSGRSGQRRRLEPAEIARAISVALCDRREALIQQAAETGKLSSQEEVAAQVRRILSDSKIEKPGLLRFFREFFEYHRAVDVFKDKPERFKHDARILVSDTDRLVRHIVLADNDVFRELLTTPLSFANYGTKQNKQTRMDDAVRAVQPDAPNKQRSYEIHAPEFVYGLSEWPEKQPTEMPAETRMGILMQPSWLVAFSTNFDNDPVRRGRWVRERLLGGTVPDLPIGVAAQVPDDKHRTFRDRLTVTRDARCWKCHRRMDDLGLPFENFDHYGRFRTTETVLDIEATVKNIDKNGKPLGPVTREVPLITTGIVADSGDINLEGPVDNPRALLSKLAASDRVRQVFIRHVFRYFLGRNETPADAATLQAADAAYTASGGSFQALVVSLLSSDTFLYRY